MSGIRNFICSISDHKNTVIQDYGLQLHFTIHKTNNTNMYLISIYLSQVGSKDLEILQSCKYSLKPLEPFGKQ